MRTRSEHTTLAGQQTRQKILDAAIPLFAEGGFSGTSVRRLADAAGVNVATLAYHFGDKKGLYREAVGQLHHRLADLTLRPEGGDPVRASVAAIFAFLSKNRDAVRLAHRHLVDAGRHPDVIVERWSSELYDKALGIVKVLQPEWSDEELRFTVHTLSHVFVRLVLEPRDQLADSLGCTPDELDDRLVVLTSRLLARQLGLALPADPTVV